MNAPRAARLIGTLSLVPLLLGAPATPAAAASDDAAAIVDRMVEAHGGMERWAEAPTVSFVDEFRSGEAEEGRESWVVVEQGERRAYIDYPGTETGLAWDGERAWSRNWESPTPPRFVALLNYHFLNLPWLAKDPGVILGEPGRGRIFDDPTEYITIKVTYEAGVGDTPDDYYELYIDPESHRLKACEYIVTYQELLPEGAESTPPHLLVYDEYATVDGLLVPTEYTIYEEGAVYASCSIRDWSFSRPFDESRMTIPEDAVLDTSTP